MRLPRNYQRTEDLKRNSYYITGATNTGKMIRNGLLNNDFLLHIHGISFTNQLSQIKDNSINLNRRYYELCRKGNEDAGSLRWFAYFHTYWIKLGYSFDLHQFTDINFPSIFFNHYAGECHTLFLRFSSLEEVTPKPKAGRPKILKP